MLSAEFYDTVETVDSLSMLAKIGLGFTRQKSAIVNHFKRIGTLIQQVKENSPNEEVEQTYVPEIVENFKK